MIDINNLPTLEAHNWYIMLIKEKDGRITTSETNSPYQLAPIIVHFGGVVLDCKFLYKLSEAQQ